LAGYTGHQGINRVFSPVSTADCAAFPVVVCLLADSALACVHVKQQSERQMKGNGQYQRVVAVAAVG
jgi:hypothetical protein